MESVPPTVVFLYHIIRMECRIVCNFERAIEYIRLCIRRVQQCQIIIEFYFNLFTKMESISYYGGSDEEQENSNNSKPRVNT